MNCRAKRRRKALGGGMRQAGVLAAAAMYSLDHVLPRLPEEHQKTQQIIQGRFTAVE
jgi:threonine aldolase